MGYYTRFYLDVEPEDNIVCPHCGHYGTPDWENLVGQFVGQQYNCENYLPFEDESKWYDWEEHMKKFSELYPDHLFRLEGNGEEDDDRWEAYFQAGKGYSQHMEMSFPDFDKRKLE